MDIKQWAHGVLTVDGDVAKVITNPLADPNPLAEDLPENIYGDVKAEDLEDFKVAQTTATKTAVDDAVAQDQARKDADEQAAASQKAIDDALALKDKKAADDEKAAADQKAIDEKAAADQKAIDEKAAADQKAIDDKAAADKAAADKKA